MNWFKSSRKKESEDYEKEYLARYKNQKNVKPKKRVSKQLDPELKTDGNKELEDRDAVLKAWHRTQNIYGYSQQQAKPKKRASKQLEQEPKTDESE